MILRYRECSAIALCILLLFLSYSILLLIFFYFKIVHLTVSPEVPEITLEKHEFVFFQLLTLVYFLTSYREVLPFFFFSSYCLLNSQLII